MVRNGAIKMPKKSINEKRLDAAELRHQAEEKLGKQKQMAPSVTKADTQHLIHELQVHQIELEMQNEQLVQAREELEALLRQYTDLYDFAPVGYFTLAPDGAIHQVNLAGAKFLGAERSELILRRFGLFVSRKLRLAFSAFLEKVFASRENESCDILLQNDEWVHMQAISADGQECRATLAYITERKRAEEKLGASENELRALFAATNDVVITLDGAGRHLLIAPTNPANLYRPSEALLGKTLHEVLPKEKADYMLAKIRQAIQTDLAVPGEYSLQIDGKEIWFESSTTRLSENSVIWVAHDITQRKQAEAAIREMARFPAENPNPVLRIERGGNLLYANEAAFIQLADWKLELGGPVPKGLNDAIQEVFKLGAEKTFEIIQGKRILSIAIQPTPGENDVSVFGLDITEHKLAEQRIQYQAFLLENINEAVIGSDSEMRLVSWNKTAEKIYGWQAGEVLGRKTAEVMRSAWAEGSIDEMVKMIEAHGHWQGEATHALKDGSRIPVELSTTVLRDAGRKLTGYVTIARDIRERKQAEVRLKEYSEHLEEMVDERTRELREAQEQLVRKEKLAVLGLLAGGVGHELRNPLGVISSSIYYLNLVQPDANEKIKKHHAMIEQEVHNATRIISDLLDYARVISTNPKAFSVPELVEHTLSRAPVPVSIHVSIKIPADLPQGYADPLHVEQILYNLITNGCQAMVTPSLNIKAGSSTLNGGGKLTITALIKKEMLAIAVKDTGTGVTPENMEKLFEPLFSTKVTGIGLGLAVSKKLAEANCGRIEVESEVGKGSAFTLYLPLMAKKA